MRFFIGRGPGPQRPDEIQLDVDDDYGGLPAKTKAICAWALANGYTEKPSFFTDDDIFVVGERLLKSGFETYDYAGRLRGPSGVHPAPYASGLGYWLSPRAMRIVAEANVNGDTAEDRFVGNVLHAAGIKCHPDYRYAVVRSSRNVPSHREGPRHGNDIIAAGEYHENEMMGVYHEWLKKPSQDVRYMPSGKLASVSILIKTFLRDGYLAKAVAGIQKNLPDAKIIVVDDGRESRPKLTLQWHLRSGGHIYEWLPFDSGFGAKGNAALKHLDRPYLLIGSDDFDFMDKNVRPGIEKLVSVLDGAPDIAIASGRVNNQAYEANLELADDMCKETPGYREDRIVNGIPVRITDLTVNYSLIRSSILGMDKIHWDGGEVKIGGGEHGAFYVDVKRAGHKVCYVPGVNINEMRLMPGSQDYAYPKYRARARTQGRPCLKARGINQWVLQDGTVELT